MSLFLGIGDVSRDRIDVLLLMKDRLMMSSRHGFGTFDYEDSVDSSVRAATVYTGTSRSTTVKVRREKEN